MPDTPKDRKHLDELVREAREKVARMTPEERAEMYRQQRESFVRGEMSWPKPRFRWENGVKVYESYEDYLND